jgi:hypothetical protein
MSMKRMIDRLRCRVQSALPIMEAILPSFREGVPINLDSLNARPLRGGLSKGLGWEP